MKAELVPENGDPPIPITKDLTVVGRRDFCDVKIDHNSLSKRHCVLVKTDGLLIIRDLATTNGTKVKGQRVRWAALLPEDKITLGALKFRVYLGPDHLPAPSELPPSSRSRKPSAGGHAVIAKSAKRAVTPPPPSPVTPAAGFPAPTPMGVSRANLDDNLEIIEEDDDDSGWRKLINSRHEEDILIDLD
jgi:predicted component of type VI protein secretion system